MPDYERPQASPQEVPPDLVECREALITCKQESEERLQALLRARADLDNHRKREAREMENTRKYAVGRLLNALLPVKDSLEMGLEATRAEPAIDVVRHGMELTLEKLDAVLADFGVETIDPKGQPFDPERHEAMSMAPIAELPPNSVAQVHQKGYLLNGRLIRPTRVSVSKAP
jgi:molecular chaperone GrpE